MSHPIVVVPDGLVIGNCPDCDDAFRVPDGIAMKSCRCARSSALIKGHRGSELLVSTVGPIRLLVLNWENYDFLRPRTVCRLRAEEQAT